MAELYDLPQELIQRICDDELDRRPKIAELDPVRVMEELEARLDALLEELASLAVKAPPRERGSILKTRLRVLELQAMLRQSISLLPRDLAELGDLIELRAMFKAMIFVLEEEGVSLEGMEKIAAAWVPIARG